MAPGAAGAARDPYRRSIAGDLLDNATDLVTVPTLLGHATVHTTPQDARRGERAKQQAVGTMQVPSIQ